MDFTFGETCSDQELISKLRRCKDNQLSSNRDPVSNTKITHALLSLLVSQHSRVLSNRLLYDAVIEILVLTASQFGSTDSRDTLIFTMFKVASMPSYMDDMKIVNLMWKTMSKLTVCHKDNSEYSSDIRFVEISKFAANTLKMYVDRASSFDTPDPKNLAYIKFYGSHLLTMVRAFPMQTTQEMKSKLSSMTNSNSLVSALVKAALSIHRLLERNPENAEVQKAHQTISGCILFLLKGAATAKDDQLLFKHLSEAFDMAVAESEFVADLLLSLTKLNISPKRMFEALDLYLESVSKKFIQTRSHALLSDSVTLIIMSLSRAPLFQETRLTIEFLLQSTMQANLVKFHILTEIFAYFVRGVTIEEIVSLMRIIGKLINFHFGNQLVLDRLHILARKIAKQFENDSEIWHRVNINGNHPITASIIFGNLASAELQRKELCNCLSLDSGNYNLIMLRLINRLDSHESHVIAKEQISPLISQMCATIISGNSSSQSDELIILLGRNITLLSDEQITDILKELRVSLSKRTSLIYSACMFILSLSTRRKKSYRNLSSIINELRLFFSVALEFAETKFKSATERLVVYLTSYITSLIIDIELPSIFTQDCIQKVLRYAKRSLRPGMEDFESQKVLINISARKPQLINRNKHLFDERELFNRLVSRKGSANVESPTTVIVGECEKHLQTIRQLIQSNRPTLPHSERLSLKRLLSDIQGLL